MKQVVFCSKSKYPSGDAMSVYFTNQSCLFSKLGYEVVFIGFGNEKFNIKKNDKYGSFISARRFRKNNLICKIFNQLTITHYCLKILFNNYKNADCVVLSSEFTKRELKKIKLFFKNNNPDTKVFIAAVEEYEKSQLNKVPFITKNNLKINKYINNDFNDKSFNFICISRYLFEKFMSKGFASIYIPFIFEHDYDKVELKDKPQNLIEYSYCGNPANKDKLFDMLEAFTLINEDYLGKIHISVVGVDKEWVLKKEKGYSIINHLEGHIDFYGKQKHSFAVEILSKSHYSMLLRDEHRTFAKAGFPTKIVESLYYGTVPITNLTSNLSEYLIDGENSIISKGNDSACFSKAIEKSIDYISTYKSMMLSSRNTYEMNFSVDCYIKEFEDFLTKAKKMGD